jgi:TRAP-type C4-dicarboxylate transport system permease small subunit
MRYKLHSWLFSALAFLLPLAAGASANPIEIKILGVSLKERLERGIEFLLSIAGSLALLLLIGSGIYYTITRGDPESQTKAKKMLISSLTGLVLVLLSYAFVYFLDNLLTK